MSRLPIDLSTLGKENWSKADWQVAEIAVDFVQKIMNDHQFTKVQEEYGNHPYKQHNRNMLDGITGVLESVMGLCQGFPEFSYDVKHIYVDGPYVTFHSHATMFASDRGNPDKGLNIYDTWKIVNDQLVEHWDAIQGIDENMRKMSLQNGGLIKNENTLF